MQHYYFSAQTRDDRTNSRPFLDRSQALSARAVKVQKPGDVSDDNRLILIRATRLQCLFTQFDSLLTIGSASDAVNTLGEIEDNMYGSYTRTKGAIFFNNAECYLALGYPKIAVNTSVTLHALPAC
jgi:hypothetical protein